MTFKTSLKLLVFVCWNTLVFSIITIAWICYSNTADAFAAFEPFAKMGICQAYSRYATACYVRLMNGKDIYRLSIYSWA